MHGETLKKNVYLFRMILLQTLRAFDSRIMKSIFVRRELWVISTVTMCSHSAQGKRTVRNLRGVFIVNSFASIELGPFCSKLVQKVTN